MQSGDWVRSWSSDGAQWDDIQSLTDLRWRVTQAALQNEDLYLLVSQADGRRERSLRLELGGLDASNVDAALMKRIGLGAPFSEPVLGEVKAGGPAAAAGLRAGDRVLRVGDAEVVDAQMLRELIQKAVKGEHGLPMEWRVERSGQTLNLTVVPRVLAASGSAAAPTGRIDAYVGQPAQMTLVRQGPVDGIVQGAKRTWEMSSLTIRMIGRMLIGEASLRNLSGPLTIADYAGQSVQQGLSYYLAFLALVSVSLGVLNLLPLPMLDGGHLMYYLFEGVTGRPVPERWLERLQRTGIAVLLMMMSVALFNDVARLLGLH